MSKPKKTKLDIPTLLALLKEAEGAAHDARERFEEWDNCEDMHDMESWDSTVEWLKLKVEWLKSKMS